MTTPALRVPFNTSTAIQQRINSGHGFDGTLPAGDSSFTDYYSYKFAIGNAGGLFFWNVAEPVVCDQFHVGLGGSGDINLYLVNLDPTTMLTATPTVLAGEEILIEALTGVTYVALDASKFKCSVGPTQALKLVTTNSSANQIAQAVASLERGYVR